MSICFSNFIINKRNICIIAIIIIFARLFVCDIIDGHSLQGSSFFCQYLFCIRSFN